MSASVESRLKARPSAFPKKESSDYGTIGRQVLHAEVPSVREVRDHLPHDSHSKSTAVGVSLFLFASGVYGATFWAMLALPGWPLKLTAAVMNGICIGVLFVVGHDACHLSLTPRSGLNKTIGRIAFLPSLHPYAAWDHSHNGLHHAWTNVRGKDPVYAPFTKAEFDALPAVRRWLERAYRTLPGMGLLYFMEVYVKYEILPLGSRRPKGTRVRVFQLDRLLVLAFMAAQVALIVRLAPVIGKGPHASAWGVLTALLVQWAVPFALWNWMMGFLTFQHHTHPKVPWYGNQGDWSFYAGQIRSVVHVEMPRPIELVLHNIMDHTAHHVDPRIPLYRLHESQAHLEAEYGDEIVTERLTLSTVMRTLRVCKLYDYERHQWLNFAGTPMTEPLLSLPPTAAKVVPSTAGLGRALDRAMAPVTLPSTEGTAGREEERIES